MAKTYAKAKDDVVELVDEVKERWHPVLQQLGVRIDVLFIDDFDDDLGESQPALKCHGYPAAATMAIVAPKHRALGLGDALLTIDTASWERLGESHRVALLDHELTHLGVVADGGGVVWADPDGRLMMAPRYDDLGRPKLKIRLHDIVIGGFRDVARRHREWSMERLQVNACRDELTGQMAWDWAEAQADAAE